MSGENTPLTHPIIAFSGLERERRRTKETLVNLSTQYLDDPHESPSHWKSPQVL